MKSVHFIPIPPVKWLRLPLEQKKNQISMECVTFHCIPSSFYSVTLNSIVYIYCDFEVNLCGSIAFGFKGKKIENSIRKILELVSDDIGHVIHKILSHFKCIPYVAG